MNILALDTSTDVASIALLYHGTLHVEEQGNIRQHAQFLLPMIDRVLQHADVKLNQLDGIAFGCGPGSFTGLRIACAIAKGLSFAHDLPLYPVNSLQAIANAVYEEHHEPHHTPVLAMIDARMQQMYWAYFDKGEDAPITQVTDARDVLLEGSQPLIFAGVGFEHYIQQLPESVQSRCSKKIQVIPHARALVRLVQSGLCQKTTAFDALPVYIRNDVAAVKE